jgi:ADP-heptose:LPS heptosyltransferase
MLAGVAHALRTSPMTAAPQRTSRVLIYVGLDRIGDGLLKLPFVRGLRTAFPNAHLTWLAGKETSVYANLLAPLVAGLLDEVIENAGIGRTPWEVLRRPLAGRRFEIIIDTQRIVWTTLSLWRVSHESFISPAARFALSSLKPPKGYRSPPNMQRQMLDLLEIASGKRFETPARLDLEIDADVRALARRLLPEGSAYVGIAPGSGGLPKCWPLERFIELARIQEARGRTPAFFLGPKESAWVPPLTEALPNAAFPLQADEGAERHGFSPLLTIALAGHLAAALANDSGTAHMFAIGAAPLIALYGTTVPEKFMPMTDRLTVIRAADFGGSQMRDIPLDAVVRAVDAAIGDETVIG